ncbi:chromatin modification-related protein eaf-1-like [Bombus bifarius]|uniref:Chromatin modification-related protein eaf-1-like n=1 Tax=Bombus bifarius TaxID=103933 RepID=A0A6P8N6T9_9HYME|nr:chromatin modification-related protein eaf-1-like [Bombus vancouverensis nearcticus]XP_033316633.1 chromatin modification-related protein eaf-1-like [Bombus bifarius]
MWLLILAGLLTVSGAEEAISNTAEKAKTSSDNAGDIVMLEIDVKEPVKRSPITATAEYGAPANQYILQSADDTQELPPEYLSVLQQYAQEGPQHQAPPPPRRVQPAYAKQQQALQQAYYNYRKPTVVPPRPRPQLHPQALAQAELTADIQAQVEAQTRTDAIRTARLGSKASEVPVYQTSYAQPKLGTFEQELLQLVSANQAQEFKLLPTQPKGSTSAYSQQLVSYPAQYAKPTVAAAQLPEQYHIETSPPRYHQPRPQPQPQPQPQPAPAYQSVEEPVHYQAAQPAEAYNQSPQYDYIDDDSYRKALEQAQAQAQAQAEAQALSFQKIAQAAYKKHHQDALAHMRLTNERYRQQSALEQIQQGAQVSDAGRSHLQEQLHPKGAEAAYRAKLKAQIAAEAAEARKLQQAQEFKAHADAIRKLEAQQQAHLKVQEEVHNYALNFEKNQARAQAIAQAQAEALYKSQLQARNQVKGEILAISKGQVQGKKVDPDSSVYHYTLSTTTALPFLHNSYFTNDQLQKYQTSGSSYVPRSVPKSDDANPVIEAASAHVQPVITQPRQTHKLKLPSSSQSVYVSESGLLKKSPIKSVTIEEVTAQPDQIGAQPSPAAKAHALTEEDLSALINAGYTVTPVTQPAKTIQQIYATDNTSAGNNPYYTKKQKAPLTRSEYVTYEEVIQRPRKLVRKNRPILKHSEKEGDLGEKVTYLVPLEPAFGTRQPALKHEE